MIAMSHQDVAIALLVANECLASVINEANGLPTRNCIHDKSSFFSLRNYAEHFVDRITSWLSLDRCVRHL